MPRPSCPHAQRPRPGPARPTSPAPSARACRHGLTVRYFRLPRLLHDLGLARADGSYGKLLAALAKADLVILDDRGLAPLVDRERRDLLEVLEDRHGRRVTLVTSQLPLEHWHNCVADPTFSDEILDRLVHQAHRITLKGTSMRRHEAGKKAAKRD